MSRGQRNELIDALKFFAMGTVVMQHELNLVASFKRLEHARTVLDALVAFAMPLFALLSGFVLWGREGSHPARFLWRKSLALVVPYLAWMAVEMPIRHWVFGWDHYAPSDWLPRLGRALIDTGQGMQMWFLIVLFYIFVAFVALRAVSRSQWWFAAAAAGSALAYLAVPDLPRTLTKFFWLLPFFLTGYLIAAHRERLARYAVPVSLAGAVLFPLSFLGSRAGGLVATVPGTVFLTAAAGIAASFGLYAIQPNPLVVRQAGWGRLSLGIYGSQMVALPFLVFGQGWTGVFVSLAATMVVTVVVSLGLERFSATRAVFLGQWPRR